MKTTTATTVKGHEKTYSFTGSAEKVLEKFGDKRPMHNRVITNKALKMGWLLSDGKTREASMYAQVLMEIKRSNRRGKQTRFVQARTALYRRKERQPITGACLTARLLY